MQDSRKALVTTGRLDEILVCDRDGEPLGRVQDLLLDLRSGRVRRLLLTARDPSRGTLALDWDRLRYDAEGGRFLAADPQSPETAEDPGEASRGPEPTSARDLTGTPLCAADGEAFGWLREVVLDAWHGRAIYALLEEEEGGRRYPLPWALLAYDDAAGGFRLETDRRRLRSAPRAGPDDGAGEAAGEGAHGGPEQPIDWTDRVWAERLHEHYGVQPYWTVRAPGRERR